MPDVLTWSPVYNSEWEKNPFQNVGPLICVVVFGQTVWKLLNLAVNQQFCTFLCCDVTAELQGREERSKQYFDKVLNGVGVSEADELLNEACTFYVSCFPCAVEQVWLLWAPCIADADIIFLSCGSSIFFYLFFLAYSQPSQIGYLPYFHTWYGLSVNLGCRSETCCTWLTGNAGPKNSPSVHHRTTL